jgi:hypothetical protein
VVLGGAYLRLGSRESALTDPQYEHETRPAESGKTRNPPYRPSKASSSVARFFLTLGVVLYVATNLLILVVNVIPPYRGSDGTDVAFQGYGYPIILICLVLLGVLYYLAVFASAPRAYPRARGDMNPVREAGLLPTKWSVLDFAGVSCEIQKDRYYNQHVERVYRFGRRWRIVYSVKGDESVSWTPRAF